MIDLAVALVELLIDVEVRGGVGGGAATTMADTSLPLVAGCCASGADLRRASG